jgi:hypothetical protein
LTPPREFGRIVIVLPLEVDHTALVRDVKVA